MYFQKLLEKISLVLLGLLITGFAAAADSIIIIKSQPKDTKSSKEADAPQKNETLKGHVEGKDSSPACGIVGRCS